MKSGRSTALLALLCTLPWAPAGAQSPNFPSRAVEVIVPYAAGGAVDAMARAFAAEAARDTSQPWVVGTREGAGGVVGFAYLSRANPDGYTVAFSPASPMTNSPFLNAKMPFRNSQVEPVCQVFENVFAIAVPKNSPIRSFAELADAARARPGGLSYGHAGLGSVPHLSMAAVERSLGLRFNAVAYRGDAPLLNDALAGTVDFSAPAIASLAGKNLRVLAVLSDRRHPAYPEVPAIPELGGPAITPGLNGLFVPSGTPAPVIARLERLCEQVAGSAGFVGSAKLLSQVPRYLGASAFKARIEETYRANAALVPELKIEKN